MHRLRPVLSNTLVLTVVLALILAPPMWSGSRDLRSARGFEADGRPAEAAAAYASAARHLPWHPDLWELAAALALQGGDRPLAQDACTRVLGRNFPSPQGLVTCGRVVWQGGDLLLAQELWVRALPDPGAYIPLAQAARQQGDTAAALAYWRLYLAEVPDDPAARYELGLLLAATEPRAALPELMLAARLDPQLDPAVQALRSGLNTGLAADNPAYLFVMAGRALSAVGAHDLALLAFRRATDLNPAYADAWALLAEARQQGGLDGTPQITIALQLDPDSLLVQALAGLYWQRQGQPGQALAAFERVAGSEPGNPVWQEALGNAYDATGDLPRAYQAYRSAVDLAPEEAGFWRSLALFCLRNGIYIQEVGLEAAYELMLLAPDDWQSYDIAGQVFLAIGDYVGAEPVFQRAVELAPEQPSPYLHLGMVYLQMGNRVAAQAYLLGAVEHDPEGPYGWQAGHLLEEHFP
ncbi:MAG: tetratricopeptide repeat protein [Anaerolineales bacterium]|nr:tetratricopeptide repeat protein [Anaerolineales bacterium]